MLQDALKKPWIEPPRRHKLPMADAKVAEAEPVKIPA
jgi:hypothetical protein